MNPTKQDLIERKNEIKKEMRILFETHLKITDWDVPETDDELAAKMIVDFMEEGLEEIRKSLKKDNEQA